MPPVDRRYFRQNLRRAMGHIDTLQTYFAAVGSPFIESGIENYGDDMTKWPEEYLLTIGSIDAATQSCELLRDLAQKILETI